MSSQWVDNIDKAVESLKCHVEILKKKADENFLTPMKVESLPKCESSAFTSTYAWKVKQGWVYGEREPNTVEEVDSILQKAADMLQQDLINLQSTHEKNIPAIENNRKIHEKVTLIMRDILKIPSSYSTYEFKTNRSSKKTETKHVAGYIGDLSRNIKTDDSYDYTVKTVKGYESTFNKIASDLKAKIRAVEIEKQKVEKAKKSVQVLARLQVKYDLSEYSMLEDVLEALDQRDKYFMLARAMEDTRGDWSEGFWRVENAIGSFQTETEEDKEIEKEISEILADDHEDGRIFRDCGWNYSAIYGKANEDILKDYEILSEYYNKYN